MKKYMYLSFGFSWNSTRAPITNVQVRLLAAAIALLPGALAASTDNLNVNVGITIIIVSGVPFLVEYIRCQR